jgi:hypothetical protein
MGDKNQRSLRYKRTSTNSTVTVSIPRSRLAVPDKKEGGLMWEVHYNNKHYHEWHFLKAFHSEEEAMAYMVERLFNLSDNYEFRVVPKENQNDKN